MACIHLQVHDIEQQQASCASRTACSLLPDPRYAPAVVKMRLGTVHGTGLLLMATDAGPTSRDQDCIATLHVHPACA
jgi:hypothetical protein